MRYTDGETDVTPDNVLAKAEEIKATVASHGLVLSNFASNQSLAEEGALPSAAVMLGAGGDVAAAAARLLKSFAECFDEAIDEAKAKVKK